MWRRDLFERVVGMATRRPLAVLAAVGLLALAGGALALRLSPSADTDTLVNRSSGAFKDTERFKRDFGDEPVVVLVKGDLQRTVLTPDLGRVLRLEGCLSGNVARKNLTNLPKVCTSIANLKPARVVYGPATFINTAVGQIQDEFVKQRAEKAIEADQAAAVAQAQARRKGASRRNQIIAGNIARQTVMQGFIQDAMGQALRYGLTSIPALNDPQFVSTLVFDSSAGVPGTPKSKFAYLFP